MLAIGRSQCADRRRRSYRGAHPQRLIPNKTRVWYRQSRWRSCRSLARPCATRGFGKKRGGCTHPPNECSRVGGPSNEYCPRGGDRGRVNFPDSIGRIALRSGRRYRTCGKTRVRHVLPRRAPKGRVRSSARSRSWHIVCSITGVSSADGVIAGVLRQRAVQIAGALSGVRQIVDKLVVKASSGPLISGPQQSGSGGRKIAAAFVNCAGIPGKHCSGDSGW